MSGQHNLTNLNISTEDGQELIDAYCKTHDRYYYIKGGVGNTQFAKNVIEKHMKKLTDDLEDKDKSIKRVKQRYPIEVYVGGKLVIAGDGTIKMDISKDTKITVKELNI